MKTLATVFLSVFALAAAPSGGANAGEALEVERSDCNRCEPAGGAGQVYHEDHEFETTCAPGFCFEGTPHTGSEPGTCAASHEASDCGTVSLLDVDVRQAVKFQDAKALLAAIERSTRDAPAGQVRIRGDEVVVESCDGEGVWETYTMDQAMIEALASL